MDKDKVCNLYFVKYFHKIGTIVGPGRKIIPSRRTDDISCVSFSLVTLASFKGPGENRWDVGLADPCECNLGEGQGTPISLPHRSKVI